MGDYFKIHTDINPEYNNRVMLIHNKENPINDKTQIISLTNKDDLKKEYDKLVNLSVWKLKIYHFISRVKNKIRRIMK